MTATKSGRLIERDISALNRLSIASTMRVNEEEVPEEVVQLVVAVVVVDASVFVGRAGVTSEAVEAFIGALVGNVVRAAGAAGVSLGAFLTEFVVAVVAVLVSRGVHHESFVGSDSAVVFLAHGSSLRAAIEAEEG